MQTWADEQLVVLRANHPEWDVWFVPCWPNYIVWCARPVGHAVATINADSPESLVDAIRQQEQDALERPE